MIALGGFIQRKKLPIGIQTFREIRENGPNQAEKTPFALRLIDQGKPCFLSRPHRFFPLDLAKLTSAKELLRAFAVDHVAPEGLRQHLHTLFASSPHDWHRNNPLAQYEGFYASVFYSHLAALGLETRVEDATNKGRIDLAVRVGNRLYLFEFKVVEQVPEGRAPPSAIPGVCGISPSLGKPLAQLHARGYAEKYREPGVSVTLVGVEFSREARNVVGFEVAEA
jgi:hypothetical protein